MLSVLSCHPERKTYALDIQDRKHFRGLCTERKKDARKSSTETKAKCTGRERTEREESAMPAGKKERCTERKPLRG